MTTAPPPPTAWSLLSTTSPRWSTRVMIAASKGALFSLQSLSVVRDGAAAARLSDITQIPSGGVIFHDGGTLDSHTATINWGDGTEPESGAVSELPFGPPGSSDGLTGRVF